MFSRILPCLIFFLGFGIAAQGSSFSPKWVGDPITLHDAQEDALFEEPLSRWVDNPDGIPLTFAFADKDVSIWFNLTNVGKLFGLPRREHIGTHKIKVLFKAEVGGEEVSETTTLIVHVKWTNQKPYWLQNPITLPNAYTEKTYAQDLNSLATDPDLSFGDVLRFEVVMGPAWVTLSPEGTFGGTPDVEDVGNESCTVRVTDANGAYADTSVSVKVVKSNGLPEIKSDIHFTVKERENFQIDLNRPEYVKDPEGDKLVFTLLESKVTWVKLESNGLLSIDPLHEHLGEHSFSFKVGDGKDFVEGIFKVTVEQDPHAPVWLEDPIRLKAIAGVEFSGDIADKAKDLDGLPITFSLSKGADWLTVSSSGILIGMPKASDVGQNTFTVNAKNDQLGSDVTVIISVEPGNHPPAWAKNPIPLPDVRLGSSLTFDLTFIAADPDDDPLTFKKINGPDWLRVGETGTMYGVPAKTDVGSFWAIVEVSDGKVNIEAGAVGKVLPENSAPVVHEENLNFSLKEGETLSLSLSQVKYVEDADGDDLNFRLFQLGTWVDLTSTGELKLNPLHEHLGDHSFDFEVSDGKQGVRGAIKVKVLEGNPRPPIWIQDPIHLTALVGGLFEANISDKVVDLQGLAVNFSKKEGSNWLLIKSDGKLNGIPGQINLGENVFKIGATNKVGTSYAEVIITVRPSVQEERIVLDTPEPDAPTEILWVVDNSRETSKYINSLWEGIRDFYTILNQAELRHVGAFLSARNWSGVPVRKGGRGPFQMHWSDIDIASDFQQRTDLVSCDEVRNSPIWSLNQFYEKAPSLNELYHQEYFTAGVPMEVFIFTAQDDDFSVFAKGTAHEGKTASDYVGDFETFHLDERQPYTVSAIDLRCPAPALITENNEIRPHYLTLTLGTFGTYYHHTPQCDDRVRSALLNYSQSVMHRAYVYAKKRIKLKDHPFDPKAIDVSIYHFKKIPLKGNTGSADDQWYYDATTNEIIVQWHQIRMPINRGDELVIEY